MKNLRIGVRLGLGFVVVVALMIAIAFIGITRLGALNDGTNIIVNDRAPKVVMAHEFIVEINTIARAARNVLLLTDQAEIKKEVDRIVASRKVAAELTDKLEKSLDSQRGRELFKDVAALRKTYVGLTATFMKLASEGKKDESLKLLMTDMRPVQTAYLDALNKFIVFQIELMKTAGADAQDSYKLAFMLMLALSVAAVVVAFLVAFFTTRSITRPMDEAVKVAQTVAKGDLTSRIEVNSTDETGQLLQALKDMNESLVRIVGEVRSSTDTITTAAGQIAVGNMDLSSRTEEQASSLEETASSMEEMTSTVRQNSDNARQANQLASTASEVAVKGGIVVSQVVETMLSINESSRKMSDIITVIDGIAFQTNILALNAAVEAARAGEQGRGFAVVATEVRSLAQRSASAAREIKTLIDDSVSKVGEGSKLVEQAGMTMDEVVESIRRVNDIMGEMTAASREQSDGIEQINQAVIQMDTVTQQNAALVEEAAAAAESLQDQAIALTNVVGVFKLDGNYVAATPAARAKPARANVVALQTKQRPPKPASVPMAASVQRKQIVNAPAGEKDWEEF